MKSPWLPLLLLTLHCVTACATGGNAWMREQYPDADAAPARDAPLPHLEPNATAKTPVTVPQSRSLGDKSPLRPSDFDARDTSEPATRIEATGKPRLPRRNKPKMPLKGKVLGRFRNTYYDFPSESDFGGEQVTLHNAQCKPLTQTPRAFFEALCVQGSGLLASGSAVSFNRRDCDCAEVCPKTQQRICFDQLDIARFPWGRGATGQAITPLLSIAVDSNVIPLGTSVYIPEFDGISRDQSGKATHDGCFIAQDRGLKVQGEHVDIFTGLRSTTLLWNSLVPSNGGVTVVVDSPQCERAP